MPQNMPSNKREGWEEMFAADNSPLTEDEKAWLDVPIDFDKINDWEWQKKYDIELMEFIKSKRIPELSDEDLKKFYAEGFLEHENGGVMFNSIEDMDKYFPKHAEEEDEEDDCSTMDETEYLLSTDANRKNLMEAVEEINSGAWKTYRTYHSMCEILAGEWCSKEDAEQFEYLSNLVKLQELTKNSSAGTEELFKMRREEHAKEIQDLKDYLTAERGYREYVKSGGKNAISMNEMLKACGLTKEDIDPQKFDFSDCD